MNNQHTVFSRFIKRAFGSLAICAFSTGLVTVEMATVCFGHMV